MQPACTLDGMSSSYYSQFFMPNYFWGDGPFKCLTIKAANRCNAATTATTSGCKLLLAYIPRHWCPALRLSSSTTMVPQSPAPRLFRGSPLYWFRLLVYYMLTMLHMIQFDLEFWDFNSSSSIPCVCLFHQSWSPRIFPCLCGVQQRYTKSLQ
jgi:hypothetical protein